MKKFLYALICIGSLVSSSFLNVACTDEEVQPSTEFRDSPNGRSLENNF